MATEQEYGPHLRRLITPLITGVGPVEAAAATAGALATCAAQARCPTSSSRWAPPGSRTPGPRRRLPDRERLLSRHGRLAARLRRRASRRSSTSRRRSRSRTAFPAFRPRRSRPAAPSFRRAPTTRSTPTWSTWSPSPSSAPPAGSSMPMIGLRGISDGRQRSDRPPRLDRISAHHRREAARRDRLRGPPAGRLDVADRRHCRLGRFHVESDQWPHHDRHRPHPRFRQPGHPAHRPPRARGRASIPRSRPFNQRRGGDGAAAAEGDHPLRRPGLGARRRTRRCRRCRSSSAGVPVLGICYGEQAMAHQLGGKVEGEHDREFGRAFVEVTKPSGALSTASGRSASAIRSG